MPLWARAVAGAGANVVTWSVMYPVDVVRSVQQSTPARPARSSTAAVQPPQSAWACARSLLAEAGIARFYHGFGFTILRAGPVAGIILPIFDVVLPWLESRLQT